jgi:hypothetical protein
MGMAGHIGATATHEKIKIAAFVGLHHVFDIKL